jgi:hypothetical protein
MHFLGGIEKNDDNPSQNNRWPSRNLNPRPTDYQAKNANHSAATISQTINCCILLKYCLYETYITILKLILGRPFVNRLYDQFFGHLKQANANY